MSGKWWDYSKSRFQFQGYLNLLSMVLFGIMAALCIWFFNPLIFSLADLIPKQVEEIILLFAVCFCLLIRYAVSYGT